MSSSGTLSISQVLKELKEEFPDVTVSKIRFLESEGLVDPDRTPSGYRKFTEADIARLRYVLRLQRDHYMPLKVIRRRLESSEVSRPVSDPVSEDGRQPAPSAPVEDDEEELERLEGGLSMSFEELVSASGVDVGVLEELQDYGLIEARENADDVTYDEDALVVAKVARDFAKFGIDPRHLKMYRNFTDREVGLFEQVVVPRHGASNRQAAQSLRELTRLSRRLKQVLLRGRLREHLRS